MIKSMNELVLEIRRTSHGLLLYNRMMKVKSKVIKTIRI